jgi:tetratricopeptide (TPR) repeat protein
VSPAWLSALQRTVILWTSLQWLLLCQHLKKPQWADAIVRATYQQYPQERLLLELLADLYLDTQQPDSAMALYQYLVDSQKDLPAYDGTLYKKIAQALLHTGNSRQAAVQLEKAWLANDGDWEALKALGELYTQQEAWMRALYYYKEAVKRQPRQPELHSHMGFVLFKLGDVEGAIQEYHQALRYGEDPIWMSNVAQTLGTLALQAQQPATEVVRYFQMAVELNPANFEALALLGEQFLRMGDLEAALAAYWQYLQHDVQSADAYCYIGYILWQMDRNNEAIDAYLSALSHDPNHAVSYNNLGVIYLDEESSPAKALGMFQTALSLQKDYTLACFNQGRALEQLGRHTEAAKAYSQAMTLNTRRPDLNPDEILERINRLFETNRSSTSSTASGNAGG